ncbi:Uncharacterized membrane protein [Pseudoxanthobacter soli DSM 19599]|uniref:Uncharacterized membrane protein n=1 Tax=Pseudoxanthobacter soli DSM 19599 TaxID=1123029 RepID=A0A1M7ZPR9_9HYPH|nr:DUF2177 family protein [Pseudoxanthobacter soli]SHO66904.1 Uncharacterized membrane protein [Pseudoxanthobacter soli DSM 19599]
MNFIIAYISTGIVFLAIDAIWLSQMANRLYRPMIGPLMADTVNVVPAILFYLLYVAGIVVFAVQPALGSGRWPTALMLGGFFGLVAYGTYDLTNHATLRDWPALITVADLIWGTVLTALSATAGLLITRALVGGAS